MAQKKTGKEKKESPNLYPRNLGKLVRRQRDKGPPGPTYEDAELHKKISELIEDEDTSDFLRASRPWGKNNNEDAELEQVRSRSKYFNKIPQDLDRNEAYTTLENLKNKGDAKLLEKLRTFENLRNKGMPLKDAANQVGDLDVMSQYDGLDNEYVGEEVSARGDGYGAYKSPVDRAMDKANVRKKEVQDNPGYYKANPDYLEQEAGRQEDLEEFIQFYDSTAVVPKIKSSNKSSKPKSKPKK
jgi:hypothetical protein